MTNWKDILKDEITAELSEQIDIFETQIELKKLEKIDDKIFAETRLRKGVYGQRYDNGQRHDGEQSRELKYPSGDKLKGPETVWDAPGMLRIKIPFGGVNPKQLRMLADLSEEYADAVVHITTRQDIQYHFVHIEDTPTIMRRLAAVGAGSVACVRAARGRPRRTWARLMPQLWRSRTSSSRPLRRLRLQQIRRASCRERV